MRRGRHPAHHREPGPPALGRREEGQAGPLSLAATGALALWWAGCSLPASAPEVDAHGPGITELSHRALQGRAGRQLPGEVSATFVADGLQVYVTGLQAPCNAPPFLALEQHEADLWLRERRAPGDAEHCGHTLLLQLDGVSVGSHVVRVLRADGSVFGEAQVTAETH